MTQKKYIIGVDIGGTNIRIGLVNENKELEKFKIEEMQQFVGIHNTADHLYSYLDYHCKLWQSEYKIIGIALGFPSIIDRNRQVVISTPNIEGLNHINIVRELQERLLIPVFIDKDVNMLLQYDMFQKDIPDSGICTGFYIGTGLGNAISINGELLIGKNGAAAELGHIPARDVNGHCGCGNTSCVELFASGKYLRHLCDENLKGASIEEVFTKHSEEPVIQKFVHDLAIPLAAEINILDPNYIIIGGGVVQMAGFPQDGLEAALHEYVRKPYPEQNLNLLYSVAGQENGVIGAGIYGFKKLRTLDKEGEQRCG